MKRNLFSYWQLAGVLSLNILKCSLLFLALLSIPLKKKVFGRRPRQLTVSLLGKKIKILLRDGADIATLIEVFLEEEYDFVYPDDVKYIIDIGAHIGSSVIYYATKFPEASIYAYEADPENYKILLANTKSFNNVHCVPEALSGTGGMISFFHDTESSIGSSLVKKKISSKEIKVSSTTFKKILDIVNPNGEIDIVKFDVEGAEYEIFSAAGQSLRNVRFFIGELHKDLIPVPEKSFLRLFIENNFNLDQVRVNDNRSIIKASRT